MVQMSVQYSLYGWPASLNNQPLQAASLFVASVFICSVCILVYNTTKPTSAYLFVQASLYTGQFSHDSVSAFNIYKY